MSQNTIVNAAPMTILRGTQDLSIRTPLIEPDVLPTHLPKVYIYAQKGPTSPQLVVGNSRNQMYGDDTFDMRKPFATHQTQLSNVINAKGNAQMIERILPDDVYFKSNLLLSLDVLNTMVPVYTRNTDGTYMLDVDGLKIPSGATVPGYICKWVVTTPEYNDYNSNVASPAFASVNTKIGTQVGVDPVTSLANTSLLYPIIRLEASSFGSYFNNTGIRLWAPNSDTGINTTVMSSLGVYPFRIAVIRRTSATNTPTIVPTEYNEGSVDFTFKPGQINPATDAAYSLGDIFLDRYQNLKDTRFPIKLGDFGRMHIFQNNIDLITKQFYDAEMAFGQNLTDLAATNTNSSLFNFINGKNSDGVPYHSYVMNSGGVNLTENTNLFAGLGFDGTMYEAPVTGAALVALKNTIATSGSPWTDPVNMPPCFADLVADRVLQYGDPNSMFMDTATYPESIIYDSGFPLKTKYALCKFISERKDTAVVLSTYDVNGAPMTASEEHSVAVALRTRLQMYPESDYFGTSTMRGMIIGRYGEMRNSQYIKKLPLTLEIASKASAMMGAGDGIWKTEMLFDRAPNSEVDMFDNVNVTFTPASVRNKDWEVGLNWVQSFSRKNLFFPALKTVYDNDTSVLNSFFTMMACVELQKVGEQAWRQFSGSVALTNGQLMDRVNTFVEQRTIGRFAGMYKIVPAAYMTDADLMRGFSWTLPIKIYANNMKTVMTLQVQAYRMTDYTEVV